MLIPLGISAQRLAEDLRVSETMVSDLLKGDYRLTADMVLRLEAYFGMEAQFWLNLQLNYDLAEARARVDTGAIRPYRAL